MVGDWNGTARTRSGSTLAVFWFLDMNGNGVWDGDTTDRMTILGWTGTTPVVGDWNGDGKTKVGTFLNGLLVSGLQRQRRVDGESTDKAYVFAKPGTRQWWGGGNMTWFFGTLALVLVRV